MGEDAFLMLPCPIACKPQEGLVLKSTDGELTQAGRSAMQSCVVDEGSTRARIGTQARTVLRECPAPRYAECRLPGHGPRQVRRV